MCFATSCTFSKISSQKGGTCTGSQKGRTSWLGSDMGVFLGSLQEFVKIFGSLQEVFQRDSQDVLRKKIYLGAHREKIDLGVFRICSCPTPPPLPPTPYLLVWHLHLRGVRHQPRKWPKLTLICHQLNQRHLPQWGSGIWAGQAATRVHVAQILVPDSPALQTRSLKLAIKAWEAWV